MNNLQDNDHHIEPLFFDEDAIRLQPRRVYKLERGGNRFYYTLDNGLKFYPSTTTVIHKTTPTSPFLIDWIADKGGVEESKEILKEASDYGTFMHAMINQFILSDVNMDLMEETIAAYCEENKINADQEAWLEKIENDLPAFAKFYSDYRIKPLAIEVVLVSEKYGFAGAVDLLCKMTIEESGFFGEVLKSGENAGAPKKTKRFREVIAVVDYKSGRKTFYESHQLQLAAYSQLIAENFPELNPEKWFNWSPKEWRTNEPTYNVKDQTNPTTIDKFLLLKKVFDMDKNQPDDNYVTVSGILSPNRDISENIVVHSLFEELSNKEVTA